MTESAAQPQGSTSETTVPPALRGWLAVFAIFRVYYVTSSAQSLLTWWRYTTHGFGDPSYRDQAARGIVFLAAWAVLDVVGLVLLLRRDHRAPGFWISRLLLGLGWFAVNMLQRPESLSRFPLTSWAIAVGLPVLWLAFWFRSPLVAATFGPAAERWMQLRRPPTLGTVTSGVLLAALWLVVGGGALYFADAGSWKIFVFALYSVVALPLWVITWMWARGAGTAIARWLPAVWLAILLAMISTSSSSDAQWQAVASFLRSNDPLRALPPLAFALAMYMIVQGVRGAATPVPLGDSATPHAVTAAG